MYAYIGERCCGAAAWRAKSAKNRVREFKTWRAGGVRTCCGAAAVEDRSRLAGIPRRSLAAVSADQRDREQRGNFVVDSRDSSLVAGRLGHGGFSA